MTFEEVHDLLNNRPPALARTVEYITRRGCRAERPFPWWEGVEPAHVKGIEATCFNCGARQPEWKGNCYGNASCQIWVCSDCAPVVSSALAGECHI